VTRNSPLLSSSFFDRDVVQVARDLLGTQLVRQDADGMTRGMIVEVEAYLHAEDPASHSYRGPTRRNAAMFASPGRAYVYTIHTHHCVNVVAEAAGRGAAVLIRAVEPLAGIDIMRSRRGRDRDRDLTSGPGKLCQAFAIDRALDSWDLTLGRQLWLEPPTSRVPYPLASSPRIGIRLAADLPLRFFLAGNRYVSGPRALRLPAGHANRVR
jgi:DNA-3-methyladenine glycosylase